MYFDKLGKESQQLLVKYALQQHLQCDFLYSFPVQTVTLSRCGGAFQLLYSTRELSNRLLLHTLILLSISLATLQEPASVQDLQATGAAKVHSAHAVPAPATWPSSMFNAGQTFSSKLRAACVTASMR